MVQSPRSRWSWFVRSSCVALAASAALAAGCQTKPSTPEGTGAAPESGGTALSADESRGKVVPPGYGWVERRGQEIMVAGRLFDIGTPVVLFTDPGGYDAYRVERRFAPWEESHWEPTTRAMAAGKLDWVSSNDQFAPTRYNLRHQRSATQKYTPEQLEQIRGGGWDLPFLQTVVDQFVLHYDVCGTSEVCFRVLQDQRGLSVHFMLDIDGTIYQTLDLKERAWHATRSNDRSIGIEIAHIGAYAVGATDAPMQAWYELDADGKPYITIPERLGDGGVRVPGTYRPARDQMIVGQLQGNTYRQYDFTPEQYDALIKLTAALCEIFPDMKPDAPRDSAGNVIPHVLTDEQWRDFKGILGHYHVQEDKQDPGPAFDWEKLLTGVNAILNERR